MADNINWYGERIKAQIRAETKRRLNACTILVQSHAKELLNTEGTGKALRKWSKRSMAFDDNGDVKTRRLKSGDEAIVYKTKRKKAGRLVYGKNPSAPGEPPHKQTGRLLASVARDVDGTIGRVGTNLKYARWLELGTRRMAARPWLRRALAERRGQVAKILTRPMNLKGG